MQQATLIDVMEWDELVESTYGKPYSFQQQDGCKERGIYFLKVPCKYAEKFDVENETVTEEVNHPEMQVSFKAWLERNPTKRLDTKNQYGKTSYRLETWWHRNFYPAVEMLANDLHQKGLLPAGEYIINIDW